MCIEPPPAPATTGEPAGAEPTAGSEPGGVAGEEPEPVGEAGASPDVDSGGKGGGGFSLGCSGARGTSSPTRTPWGDAALWFAAVALIGARRSRAG